MASQLLVRLDDACPWHDRSRWQKIEYLLDKYNIKPLVAVIPDCQDPDLTCFPHDDNFWERARAWQAKGWAIALHGSTHVFETTKSGIVPLNKYSEFAGVEKERQRQKIVLGTQILAGHQLNVSAWVAPAHSFDASTLEVLRNETPIRLVSDGLSHRAFRRFGFVWVPQQLWRPRQLKSGLWTLCLHPNEMLDNDFERLDEFLSANPCGGSWQTWIDYSKESQNGATPHLRSSVPAWGLSDAIFGIAFLALRRTKHLIRKLQGKK